MKNLIEEKLKEIDNLSLTREELLEWVSIETELKSRNLINKDINRRVIAINDLLEEISIRITWLVEIDDNFDYTNLIEFKRDVLEKIDINNLKLFEDKLTFKQKEILENYRKERYLSVIYWSPLYETNQEKINLKIWEELYFIAEKIKNIFN